MLKRHAVLYLGSRALAAAGNMFSVAVFTRLAGAEVYGGYLVTLAAANVIGGFAIQWARYAFFANYHEDDAQATIASFAAIVFGSLCLSAPVAVAVITASGSSARYAASAWVLAIAMGSFDATNEIFRTRLAAERVVVAGLLRTVLVLALGTLLLVEDGSPTALALAVAAANLIATLPSVLALRRLTGRPSLRVVRAFLQFGWPLILSFGIGAFAQNADRFILDRDAGTAVTGAYGASSDIVRATFTVVAEALAASIVSIAKKQYTSGDRLAAETSLGIAYKLFTLLTMFGSLAFLMFGDEIFRIIFPPSIYEVSAGLIPVLILSSSTMVLRNFYFGQVIYFSRASHLELISSAILLVVNTGLCFTLIPAFGAFGAAVAFLAGQTLSMSLFLVAGGRAAGSFRMPVLLRPTALVAALAALAYVPGGVLAALHAPRAGTALANICALGAACLWAIVILELPLPSPVPALRQLRVALGRR